MHCTSLSRSFSFLVVLSLTLSPVECLRVMSRWFGFVVSLALTLYIHVLSNKKYVYVYTYVIYVYHRGTKTFVLVRFIHAQAYPCRLHRGRIT